MSVSKFSTGWLVAPTASSNSSFTNPEGRAPNAYLNGFLRTPAFRPPQQTGRRHSRCLEPTAARTATCAPSHAETARPLSRSVLAVQLVDTEGTPVPIDERPVSVTVEGGARLMGLGSASPVTEHSFLHAESLTFEGRAQAIIGMTQGQEGMVVVSVDGLPPHTVSV